VGQEWGGDRRAAQGQEGAERCRIKASGQPVSDKVVGVASRLFCPFETETKETARNFAEIMVATHYPTTNRKKVKNLVDYLLTAVG
jgi:hypothetical protein